MSASLASTSATTVVASPLTSASSQDAKTALVAASLSSSAASPLLSNSSPRSRSIRLHADVPEASPRLASPPSSPWQDPSHKAALPASSSSSRSLANAASALPQHREGYVDSKVSPASSSSAALPGSGLPLVDDPHAASATHVQSSHPSLRAASSVPASRADGEMRTSMRKPSLARAPTRQARNARPTTAGATVVGGGVDLKVVILGAQGVGKTSLVHRYITGTFQASSIPSTIGASFLTQKLVVDGTKVRLQLWDTAGQERFRSMAPMYYRGSNAAVIVYDITNAASFQDVKTWIDELRKNVTSDLIIQVVGSKLDLAPAHREVYLDEARDAVLEWTTPAVAPESSRAEFGPSPSLASPSRLGLVPAGGTLGKSNSSSGASGSAGSSEGAASNAQLFSQLHNHPTPSSWETVEVTEVSAKAGEAVEDVFVNIASRLVERKAEIEAEKRRRERDSILLRDEPDGAHLGTTSGAANARSSFRNGWGGCC